ncbi:carbohydrate kinase family protein [Mucilaginibacter jinjuensis]|uniref:Carbohydrate kinase n=1 Tax=Mucilaginibacter jinjuensis TaxID=1176721 RepID=A0ABY7T546_9SPHI|nr:carbohydrate kinase [Mucilaginibacter jinjuensis]WCT11492.1 carbohydrate kinase [Mucilaginibacter jinjuensis]
MNNQVLCYGEVLWDTFGKTRKAGGAPMNVAWNLKQQGKNVVFASSVGSDALGDELINFLQKNGLYSPLIQQDKDLPTCVVTVQLDEKQQATYTIPEPVSWDNIIVTPELLAQARNSSAIVFGTLACRETVTRNTLYELLDETSALTVFDVNLRAPHYQLDTIQTLAAKAKVIKMNEEEADLLIGRGSGTLKDKIIEFQRTYHPQTICVTRGDKGAILWHDDEFFEHPGFKVDVVDTVGAGDSFLATLTTGLLNNEPMQQIVARACCVGAFVTSKQGATPSYKIEEIVPF